MNYLICNSYFFSIFVTLSPKKSENEKNVFCTVPYLFKCSVR